ncbi:MAG: carbohydrate binding domain-containing protein [Armatimonadota bacterium]|jgi:hypothetical protein
MSRHIAIVLVVLAGSGIAPAQTDHAIDHLSTAAILHEDGSSWHVQVRFITSEPAICHVDAGPSADNLTPGEPGAEVLRNHRFDVPGEPGASRFVRVVGASEEAEFASEIIEVAPPAPFPAGNVDRVEIPLTVEETAGTQRAEPVTFGIPLPEGALGDPSRVRLSDGGTQLPLQTRALVRWPDRSVKWLLVSTGVALEAYETKTLSLELGTAVDPLAAGDMVTEDEETIRVETRAGQFAIERATGAGAISGPGGDLTALPTSRLVADDGTVFIGQVERVEIEERGPQRAVILAAGQHRNEAGEAYFGFEIRYFLRADDPFVRIDHILQHDIVSPEMEYGDEMKSFASLDLVFPTDAASATVALEDGAEAPIASGQRLFQHEDNAYDLPDAEGGRAPGLATIGGLTVAARDFWQNWPKAFEVDDGALAVGLYPRITPSDRYANRPNEHILYYHVRDGRYTFRAGLEKRHELLVGPAGAATGDEVLARVNRPLLVTAPPGWYIDSGAVHDIAAVEGREFEAYNEALSRCVEGHLALREADRWYGLMNFGDWWGERVNNWGNVEYDMQHANLTQYFRTGDRRFFDLAEQAARHNADIDVVHHAAGQRAGPGGARRVGQAWVHSMGHTGGYYPHDYMGMSIYSQGYCENRGHMWNQGNLTYWLLTGDAQVRRAAIQLADWSAGPDTVNFSYGNARVPGWMGIIQMSTYFATHDPYYLNAMRLMYEQVEERGDPEAGLWVHRLSGGHCGCEDPHYGEAGFMAGVLMTSLKYFYLATGDEEVAERIVKIANWVVESLYEPEEDNFRYTSCPHTNISTSSPTIIANGLAFAANYSGDEQLMELTRRTFLRGFLAFAGGSQGKSFASATCSAPMAIHEISRFSGPTLDELYTQLVETARDPARRPLPSIVPNPNFEDGLSGWRARPGPAFSLSTDVVHSGRASAMADGTIQGQNEYFVTHYDCGPPWEIMSLDPGEDYRMQLWLRIDEITEGAPAPSARLAPRSKGVTRGSFTTNEYDLSRLGEWQLLETEFTVPAETDAAYIAVSTHTRDAVTVRMYLDDITIVPADQPRREVYAWVAGKATEAEPAGGVAVTPEGILDGWEVLATPDGAAGTATFALDLPVDDDYAVLVRAKGIADGDGRLDVAIDGEPHGSALVGGDGWSWVAVGAPLRLSAGAHTVTVGFPANVEVMLHSVLVTNGSTSLH